MTCWRGYGSAPPPCPPCCPGETGACSPPPVHPPRHTGNSLRVQHGGMGVCAASGTFAAAESAPGRRAARSAPPNCGGTCCAAGCAPVDSRVGTAVRFRVLKCACSTLCDALGRLWQSPLYVIDPAANGPSAGALTAARCLLPWQLDGHAVAATGPPGAACITHPESSGLTRHLGRGAQMGAPRGCRGPGTAARWRGAWRPCDRCSPSRTGCGSSFSSRPAACCRCASTAWLVRPPRTTAAITFRAVVL